VRNTGKQILTRDEQNAFFKTPRRAGVKIVAPSYNALLT